MAGTDEVNSNESRRVVPLNTYVLIYQFKVASGPSKPIGRPWVAYNLLRRPDGTFNRDLAEYLDRKVTSNPKPVNGVFSFDYVIDHDGGLVCRIYRPATPESGDHARTLLEVLSPVSADDEIVPVIIFFHGGSFAHSSINSSIYDLLCRHLVSNCKAVVVSVNYRRAPEYRYPCAYDDGWKALEWVSSRRWLQSRDSKVHIYLAGDSSGGNIVHNISVRAVESEIRIYGNVVLNPMFGGEERTESEERLDGRYFVTLRDRDWYWKAYLPEGETRDHPSCNPFGPRKIYLEGVKFPKSLVVVAGFDLVQDWQLAYAEGLENAGHRVKLLYLEKATVGFYLLPNNEHFYLVMDEIKSFLSSDPDSQT